MIYDVLSLDFGPLINFKNLPQIIMPKPKSTKVDGKKGAKQLTLKQRADIIQMICVEVHKGKIADGAIAIILKKAKCSWKAVNNIWLRLNQGEKASSVIMSC